MDPMKTQLAEAGRVRVTMRDETNKYDNRSVNRLLREYQYLRPMGSPGNTSTINSVQEMADVDTMHLLKVCDAMARRIQQLDGEDDE